MSQSQKFIIIDAPAVLHRAWHALPRLTDPKGRAVSAVYGFASLLLKLIREYQPDYIATTFDTPAPTFRHQEYKEYKATRIPQPQEFYDQIPITKELLQTLKIPILEKDGYEADDFIGTLAKISPASNLIVTGDLDTLQLVNQNTAIYFLRQGISEIKIYDQKAVEERYGLKPQQLIDYKALRGDPSDNIPGVKGIGEKTALSLIQKFGSLGKIYENIEQLPPTTKKLLLEQKEMAFLSKKLVTIKSDLPVIDNSENYQFKKIDQEKVKEFLQKLGFKSLIQRLEKNNLPNQKSLF